MTIKQKPNADGFVKPGELVDIRAGHDLSLQDRRIFNLLIENAWADIQSDQPHSIAIARLRGNLHRGTDRVQDSIKALMTTLVEVPTTLDGKKAMFSTQLLGETTRTIDEDSPSALLVYSFNPGLRKIIMDSRYWGRLKAYVMFAFGSKYALALYEAVCLRGNRHSTSQKFTVDDFRALLGVEPGKLTMYKSLKQRVLDPAMLEVNGLSDFNVDIKPLRDGGMLRGPLTGFELTWERKTAEEWKSCSRELLGSKIGRAARLAGTVEKMEAFSYDRG